MVGEQRAGTAGDGAGHLGHRGVAVPVVGGAVPDHPQHAGAACGHSLGVEPASQVGWGGLFGVSRAQKARIVSAMKQLSAIGWPYEHELYRVHIGWDPAHIQSGSNW